MAAAGAVGAGEPAGRVVVVEAADVEVGAGFHGHGAARLERRASCRPAAGRRVAPLLTTTAPAGERGGELAAAVRFVEADLQPDRREVEAAGVAHPHRVEAVDALVLRRGGAGRADGAGEQQAAARGGVAVLDLEGAQQGAAGGAQLDPGTQPLLGEAAAAHQPGIAAGGGQAGQGAVAEGRQLGRPRGPRRAVPVGAGVEHEGAVGRAAGAVVDGAGRREAVVDGADAVGGAGPGLDLGQRDRRSRSCRRRAPPGRRRRRPSCPSSRPAAPGCRPRRRSLPPPERVPALIRTLPPAPASPLSPVTVGALASSSPFSTRAAGFDVDHPAAAVLPPVAVVAVAACRPACWGR